MTTANHNSDFGDGGARDGRHHWALSLQVVTVHLCLEKRRRHTTASHKWQNNNVIYWLFFYTLPFLNPPMFRWEQIPVLWTALKLVWVLCSGGRGVGCLSGHTTGQSDFLSAWPGMTALHCWLLSPPGGYHSKHTYYWLLVLHVVVWPDV